MQAKEAGSAGLDYKKLGTLEGGQIMEGLQSPKGEVNISDAENPLSVWFYH